MDSLNPRHVLISDFTICPNWWAKNKLLLACLDFPHFWSSPTQGTNQELLFVSDAVNNVIYFITKWVDTANLDIDLQVFRTLSSCIDLPLIASMSATCQRDFIMETWWYDSRSKIVTSLFVPNMNNHSLIKFYVIISIFQFIVTSIVL